MSLFARFFGRLAAWGGAVVLLQVAMGGFGSLGKVTGVYATLALIIAPFPAGANLWKDVFPDERFSPRGFGLVMGLGAMASALYFLLIGYVGPALAVDSTLALSNPELREAVIAAIATASASAAPTAEVWYEANRLAVYYVKRTDGAALPLIFTLLGVLSGFWAARIGRLPWERLQLWAMGVFLLMSTYLASENGHELVIAQAAGPVAFVGDFLLIVPGALLIGLGWATLALTWWGVESE